MGGEEGEYNLDLMSASGHLHCCARFGSSVPWHNDDESSFGEAGDSKLVVSLNSVASATFRFVRPVRTDHGRVSNFHTLWILVWRTRSSTDSPGRVLFVLV